MKYDVTIGIPLYKAKDYVQNTMLSALAQTYSNIEFLVVDDCGNDGSLEIIEELQQTHPRGAHIRILRNTKNFQVGYTRNKIIDEARGDYLYFLDSDDFIEPNTIQLLVDEISQHQAQVVYASYEVVDKVNGSPNRIYRKPKLQLFGQGELAHFAFQHASIFHVSVCNCLFQVSFLRTEGVRFIDTAYWEDMAFTYEFVVKVSRAVLLPNVTYHYILRPGSLSHYQDREQLEKKEIMNNILTINYLKGKCKLLEKAPYLPYLCYNLEMSSFYIVCHILKHVRRISPSFSYSEMRDVLCHPMTLSEILSFRVRLLQNLVFWLLCRLPAPLFVLSVWVLGKVKRAI